MPKKTSRTAWYAVVIIIIAIVIGVSAYYVWMGQNTTPTATPNVTITLYEGEASTSLYGFGYSASSLASPGPTLNFKVGDVVNMTVINVGTLPHAWEISDSKTGGNILFNAQIATSSPLNTGQRGNVIFTVNQAGNFFYICPVPGHSDLGMWGNVVVTSS